MSGKLTEAERIGLLKIRRWERRGSTTGRIVRLMGLVEGYYVARYKGSSPFLRHANDWLQEFAPADPQDWESMPGNMVTPDTLPRQEPRDA